VLVPPVTCSQDSWYALSVYRSPLACFFIGSWSAGEFLADTAAGVRHDELAAEVLVLAFRSWKANVFTIGSVYSACAVSCSPICWECSRPESEQDTARRRNTHFQ